MGDYENKLIDAIEAVVEDKIKNAGYDRTILVKVMSCVDPTIGKYRVRYQDSTFFAYAITTETQYIPGTEVYVLIASNDSSKDKTILGSVDKLGSNYNPEPDVEDHYEVVGKNCIDSYDTFELCSYSGNVTKVLYDRDDAGTALVQLNTLSVDTYIRESGSIVCGGTFRTALPVEQQFRGNYGIIFELAFLDNASNDLIYKQYYMDVNQMLGNPYKYLKPSRQVGVFDIDAANFQYVNKISIFVEEFPHTREGEPADIFISNLELMGSIPLDDTDVNACALVVNKLDGTYFNIGDSDDKTLRMQAQVRVKGKSVDNNSQYLEYYWFVENCLVNSSHEKYSPYGGNGWACLNDYNVVSESANGRVVAWVPGTYQFNIKKSDCPAKATMFKCVAVLNDLVLSNEFKITNYASLFDISVASDSGVQFYYDIGNPTLTCLINNEDRTSSQYKYVWAEADYNGNFQVLEETTSENSEYNAAAAGYAQLQADIEAERAMAAASQNQLDAYLTTMKKYDKIMRVEGNKIHSLNVSRITNFATYKCSVFRDDVFIGTSSIVITNSLENADYYNIVINNGTQVYKYNADGVYPLNTDTLYGPVMDIDELSVSVFDCLGALLDDEIIEKCDVRWRVPTVNTLLVAPDGYDEDTGTEKIYKNRLKLTYSIATKYEINKSNNDIIVEVNYKNMPLSARTHFTFTKDGEPGTNGTQFVAQIVPNTTDSFNEYPMILNSKLNYTPLGDSTGQQWFRLKFWHNGEMIYNSAQSGTTSEGNSINITWSVLANRYNSSTRDNTDITVVDSSRGYFRYNGYSNASTPANIIKCTVRYGGVDYYATLPLITAKANNGYAVSLIKDTGFRFATYSPDGRAASYDNTKPFELKVTRVINGVVEDISRLTAAEAITYNWNVRGKVYEYNGSSYRAVNYPYLIEEEVDNLARNQKKYKPADDFNGECVNVGLECVLLNKGQAEIGRIHIPIHLMLNRYGQGALNGWDGNQVSINESGGYILSPQVGAGIKERDNSFTGALMGKVKEANKQNIDVGLFAYKSGVRTFFLNANDGSALFGRLGNGQLVIDPSQDKAYIYSYNYWRSYNEDGKPNGYGSSNENGRGMLIDLTTPAIKFGSGDFSVDSNGFIHSKGGGDIAGWQITDTDLHSSSGGGNISISSSGSIQGSNGTNTWWVHSDGTASFNNVKITGGTTGGWNITDEKIYSSQNNIQLWAKGRMEGGSTGKEWSIAEDGTATFNNAIIVGNVTANSGKIGKWIIEDGAIYNGNVKLNANGDIDCSAGAGWYIHNDGSAKFGNMSVTASGDVSVNNLTANGGTFNDITANRGNYNNIVASSATFNSCTVTDSCTIECQIKGNLITSGIDANNITTGTLNANRIGAKSITSGKLSVNELAAVSTKTGNLEVTGDLVASSLKIGAEGYLAFYEGDTAEGKRLVRITRHGNMYFGSTDGKDIDDGGLNSLFLISPTRKTTDEHGKDHPTPICIGGSGTIGVYNDVKKHWQTGITDEIPYMNNTLDQWLLSVCKGIVTGFYNNK